MNEQDILIALFRINSDLDRIFKSRGWLRILESINEPIVIETALGSAMFHSLDLKLRIQRILEQKKYKEVA